MGGQNSVPFQEEALDLEGLLLTDLNQPHII